MTPFPNRILLLLAFALAAATAWAQDPPARVGRLAYIENDVEFSVDRNQRGEPASINWPISSGAVIETGRAGRAETWIGSTAYRLNERSRAEFATIDDRRVDLRLEGGSLGISVLDRDQADDIVVATPDGQVRFATAGRYRIDVFADSTELSVFAGQAVFEDRGRGEAVAAGQQLVVWSDGRRSAGANRDQDAFDLWVAERENATLAGAARRHVSPRMTGYADLDVYGDWQSLPEYGTVWYPRGVAADWAPYRYGRWVWIAPWGWTWVDESPWGFAPFHYGRWALIGSRWAWVPGSYVATPVYAPALVAWVGDGGWSVGFSFGRAPAVGWFPLGPREVYVPAYRHSPTYVRLINVTHIHNHRHIDRAVREGGKRRFEYQARPQAVTVVPAQRLHEGAPIGRRDVRIVKPAELERAPRLQHAPSAALRTPGERLRGEVREGAGAPRSSLLGGEAQRPGGERGRGDFRQSQPERREAAPVPEERRSLERRPPEGERGRPEAGRSGDFRQSLPERREAAPAREERRSFERRPPEGERGQPEAGRGGDVRQAQPERREAAPAPEERRSFERRLPEGERGRPEAGRGGDVRQSLPERREAAPAPEERRSVERRPPEGERGQPEAGRSGDVRQSQPERRELPRPAPEMPRAAPEVSRPPPAVEERRSSERRPPEMAPRREERETFRSERPVPRESEAPAMRQREMPRAAPEMPRPAPEMPRAAPEAPRPPPQPMREAPRSEPPRMQAPAQPQGGGGGGREQKREERRDERGGRGS